MKSDRRAFFRTIGAAGLTLAIGNSAKASAVKKETIEFKGILYDSTRCVACRQCESACAESHNLPQPTDDLVAGIERKTSEKQRTVINLYNTSRGEVPVKKQCMHCNEPACAAACLTQAMFKTREGPVIWRGEKCMGCRYCMVSCPFEVPKFEYHSANPRIQKCDMCYERIAEGKVPACVDKCAGALTFGTRRELLTDARKRIMESPGNYIGQIYGESVAGGTSYLYIGPAPFSELGMNTALQESSYPALTRGFLYSVPAVFILLPSLLLGIHESTKGNRLKEEGNE
ncbi:MAG TPA: 4Fe-4S dicluster domain-containing protein [Bacteroidales bacterium]|nr:4Fe-4S dicluster domain-containing protein [Bacteroidales bacterium]